MISGGTIMTNFHFSRNVMVFVLGLLFLDFPFSSGQDVPAANTTPSAETTSDSEPIEPLQIKLSVNEVRLDIVVLDKKTGNPVTDLSADDFEIFQNNRKQKILAGVYVDTQSGVVAKPSIPRKAARNLPALPPPATPDLKKEDTRRTVIFVVDDLSMNFENGYYAKMALRNFVEKQMQTGDMVAILKTSYGNSALQMFLSDKREAIARINAMRLERSFSPRPDDSDLAAVFDSQLSTLSYGVRALKDMPGRKILIMMTTQTTIPKPPVDSIKVDLYALYYKRFIKMADDALRAGVVANFLDIRGLHDNDPNLDASINFKRISKEHLERAPLLSNMVALTMLQMDLNKQQREQDLEDPFNPLPFRTGGVLIENSNFFLDGIGRETESLMKGYYLISYTPPPDTFRPGDKEIYHQVKVNVKRRNVQIYTRNGFFNRLESEADAAAPAAQPLQNAIFSPFLHSDLNVNMAAGYVRDAKAGYLIRSWIHVDPKDVKIVETQDGGARIDLEMICLTSDANGFVQDSRRGQLTISNVNSPENVALLQQRGIRFVMLLPVKKPGSYYVRTAVEDTESGRIGSAYQFVEIPDLEKKEPALSSIFMAADEEGFNWMRSDLTAEIAEAVSFSGFQDKETRNPALRTYASGDRLQTLAMLYNAGAKADSEIEVQSILYKDGEEFMRGEPMLISQDAAQNPNGFPIMQNWTAGTDMPPGEYVLQILATDKKDGKKNEGSVYQTLSFTVTENQTCEKERVQNNMALALKLGITGVPGFVIGHIDSQNPGSVTGITSILGALPFSSFQKEIEAAIAANN